MKILTMRRTALLCAGLGAVGAISAVAFTGTSAQISGQVQTPQTNNFTGATLSISEDAASVTANVLGYLPGDGSCYSAPAGADYTCNLPRQSYIMDLSGTANAFVGLKIDIKSTAKKACYPGAEASLTAAQVEADCTDVGTAPLFDGNTSGGALDLALSPVTTSPSFPLLTAPTISAATTCSADASGVVTCEANFGGDTIIVPKTYNTAGNYGLEWTAGSSNTLHIDSHLPLSAGNQYQGSGATVTLQAFSVQYDNNQGTGNAGTCAPNTLMPASITQAGGAGNAPCPISWG